MNELEWDPSMDPIRLLHVEDVEILNDHEYYQQSIWEDMVTIDQDNRPIDLDDVDPIV